MAQWASTPRARSVRVQAFPRPDIDVFERNGGEDRRHSALRLHSDSNAPAFPVVPRFRVIRVIRGSLLSFEPSIIRCQDID